MAQQKQIISTINGLIETLKDGEQGYSEAAEAVKDAKLKSIFSEYAQQRSQFAAELQDAARRLGEPSPEEDSSVAGAMHRAWIDLKAAITRGDDHAILAECERGEDSAVNEFKEAMEDVSSPPRDVVANQYAAVKTAHDRIRSLRDAAKPS